MKPLYQSNESKLLLKKLANRIRLERKRDFTQLKAFFVLRTVSLYPKHRPARLSRWQHRTLTELIRWELFGAHHLSYLYPELAKESHEWLLLHEWLGESECRPHSPLAASVAPRNQPRAPMNSDH